MHVLTSPKIIGIMGGTFNPIHYGHLRIAEELAQVLNLAEVCFIPSANPPHRTQPSVSAKHRVEMTSLAIANNSKFKLDTRELQRQGASYTIDTLQSLRAELGDHTAICLLMGSDAFVQLNTWHRWDELLNYCHIVLAERPNTKLKAALAPALQTLLQNHYTEHMGDLALSPAGHITMQQVTALDISATAIREDLKQGRSVRYLMPDVVIDYIHAHHLYGCF